MSEHQGSNDRTSAADAGCGGSGGLGRMKGIIKKRKQEAKDAEAQEDALRIGPVAPTAARAEGTAAVEVLVLGHQQSLASERCF
jgi:hypothetical protein